MKKRELWLLSFFVVALLFSSSQLFAATYYEGKKITRVVGFGPGGGYDRIGRPYVAPPGIPPDIAGILRDAFGKMAKDSEIKEEANKMKMSINYVSPDECLKKMNYILN